MNSPSSTIRKKKIAVLYGGTSPEHDVSVVTALQIYSAIDSQRFDKMLVYISPDGRWFIGDKLTDRNNYIFDVESIKALTQVTLDTNRPNGMQRAGRLRPLKKGLFKPDICAEFDIALPAFHGLHGEDGHIQGLLEQLRIPYTGMRAMMSSLLMDKAASKHILKSLGIKALPCAVLRRKDIEKSLSAEDINAAMSAAKIEFPCILKPAHLGSSIGVAKVTSAEDVSACLPAIFGMDNSAILEPFVENLAEYNVSVHNFDGTPKLSAIERPKSTEELLDFKQKYLSGGSNKNGDKMGGQKSAIPSQGMLSLTRDLNPDMPKKIKDKITKWATTLFSAMPCHGAPRIDFICNAETQDVWLNEVNPLPGSLGYFLWEAADNGNNLLFTELLTKLIEEAEGAARQSYLPKDPVPKDARLLKRSLSEG